MKKSLKPLPLINLEGFVKALEDFVKALTLYVKCELPQMSSEEICLRKGGGGGVGHLEAGKFVNVVHDHPQQLFQRIDHASVNPRISVKISPI